VLIYNHHDDWDREGDYTIELEIIGLPFDGDEVVVTHQRIDQAQSNAYAERLRQGRPMYPTPGERAALTARDDLELLEPPRAARLTDGKATVIFTLPVHGVSLLSISPARA
jgi:xylan 1,4-beta-xylosidase